MMRCDDALCEGALSCLAAAQEGRRWVDQPQSALVLDDELFESAREQWQQSSGSASTSGQPGDYYSLLGVTRVSIAFTLQHRLPMHT